MTLAEAVLPVGITKVIVRSPSHILTLHERQTQKAIHFNYFYTTGMKEPQSFKTLQTAYKVMRHHVQEKWILQVRSDWLQHAPILLVRTYHSLNTCIKWQAHATNFHPDLTRRTHTPVPHLPYLRSFLWCLQQKG